MEPIEAALVNLIRLQRVGTGLTVDAQAEIAELFDRLVRDLTRIDPAGTTRRRYQRLRMAKVLEAIEARSAETFDEILKVVRGELARLGVQQGDFAAAQLRSQTPPRLVRFLQPGELSVNRIKAILDTNPIEGELLRDWFRGLSDVTVTRARRELQTGMLRAETNAQLIDRLIGRRVGRVRQGGVVQLTYRDAETIVRTSVTEVSAVAHFETFRANPRVSEEYVYVATLDDRTSKICLSLHKRRFRYDDPKALRPPQHPRCRSGIIPVIIGVPVEIRSAEEFLRSISEAGQEGILGKARARLWREGTITLRDLIRDDGAIMTVDELVRAA